MSSGQPRGSTFRCVQGCESLESLNWSATQAERLGAPSVAPSLEEETAVQKRVVERTATEATGLRHISRPPVCACASYIASFSRFSRCCCSVVPLSCCFRERRAQRPRAPVAAQLVQSLVQQQSRLLTGWRRALPVTPAPAAGTSSLRCVCCSVASVAKRGCTCLLTCAFPPATHGMKARFLQSLTCHLLRRGGAPVRGGRSTPWLPAVRLLRRTVNPAGSLATLMRNAPALPRAAGATAFTRQRWTNAASTAGGVATPGSVPVWPVARQASS
ncbi:hypothetical protein QF048_007511 [Streptomyces sp. W4I9-2]|nr:hypothetical protein [Streptomyces sp. W4I9-2]